jgi:hypothetical protein
MKTEKLLLQKLYKIHESSPLIHRFNTERASEDLGRKKFWGVTKDLIQYILATVDESMTTAETGCGISTLAFSAAGATHTVVTPDAGEESAVRKEAEIAEINLSKTRFAIGFSENVLPKLEFPRLSLALIDGKHAFPWPIIDWFYFARAMKKDSIMIIDDASMPSVKMLCDILHNSSSDWRQVKSISDGQSLVFQCLKDNVADIVWDEQLMNVEFGKPPFRARVIGKLQSMLKSKS